MLAVNVTVPLVHVILGLALAVTVGKAFTVTSAVVIVDVQPVNVLVPVTVYVVVFIGDTLVVLVFAVVLQVYVSAPFAVSVTGLPAQVVALDVVTSGNVFTLMVSVSVVVAQPDASPVMVYVVCMVGVSTIVLVVI